MRINICLHALVLLLCVVTASAGQNYTVGSSVDLVTSLDNDPQGAVNLGLPSGQMAKIQSGFPSLQVRAAGQQSALSLRYDYGYIQIHSDSNLHSESQSGLLDFSKKMSDHVTMRLSGNYFRSPDLTAFNFFRGVIGSTSAVYGDSGVISLRRKTTSTTGLAAFEVASNPRSTWAVSFGGYTHKYEDTSIGTERLSNVDQFITSLDYKHKISEHSTWSLSYSASQYRLKESPLDNMLDHDMSVRFTHQISPSALVSISGGPSYTRGVNSDWQHIGYNGSFTLSKTLGENRISLAYSKRNGAGIGVGLSDIQTVMFDIVRHLSRKTTIANSYSLYDSKQLVSTTALIRGGTGAAVFTYAISKHVGISIAGEYQRQRGEGILAENRRLVTVSLKLSAPSILKGGR